MASALNVGGRGPMERAAFALIWLGLIGVCLTFWGLVFHGLVSTF